MHATALAYKLAESRKHSLVLVEDNTTVDEVASALDFFCSYFGRSVRVGRLYAYQIPPVSAIEPDRSLVAERLKSIYMLIEQNSSDVVVASAFSLVQPMVDKEQFLDLLVFLRRGATLDPATLQQRLTESYYQRVQKISKPGEFAKRGGIVDLFSPMYDKPLRIEFFDDEVESIRMFLPSNQRTVATLDEAIVLPASEYAYREDNFGYSLLASKCTYLDEYAEGMDVAVAFDGSYLDRVFDSLKLYVKTYGDEIFLSVERIKAFLKRSKRIEYEFEYETLFPASLDIGTKLQRMREVSGKERVIVACGSDLRKRRVFEFLSEKGIVVKTGKPDKPGIYLVEGYLKRGLRDKRRGVSFVSFEDLFGKAVSKSITAFSTKRKSFEKGSLVVHKHHGIGIYRGIRKLDIEGMNQDFIEIEYAKGDRLYVPVYAAENIFSYHGSAELSTLGSSKWKAKSESIKRSIKKILTELIATYAKRQLARRPSFDVDTLFYKEFETLFEYEETPDQAQAIEDIKRDMSSERPMDRLICGDVSFGKTEVAMRACAICVFNSRQAVVMVPTTILSLQHYRTFLERFSDFPVNIAVLNRFTTKAQREKIKRDLKRGVIDILIATHSVYSKDIEFANLGLVVIDEEQRFGVKIKEHFKARYPHVDMLYLSATPIPRTLNMALNGIFDISVIKTPPLDRKPIETYVLKRKQQVIRDAILRELSRSGSVYFVHNSIETIGEVKRELEGLVPFAKMEIIHAKMPKSHIKKTLERFNNGEFEILISTSIIESGLNIKSVNTIIIDNAERFGLSDLYQLRGRVGRADKQAYAYLLVGSKLTDDAKKRLAFMKEFMERGVGFNLALKDMEIRGGGNILGKDQSGNIRAVGFETYASLIEEAISEMKGSDVPREVEIRSVFDAYIDDQFATGDEKLEIYRMISMAKSHEELDEIEEHIRQEYGPPPESLKNLFSLAAIKIDAMKAYVKRVSISSKMLMLEFYIDARIDTDKLIRNLEEHNGRFVSQTAVVIDSPGSDLREIQEKIRNILHDVAGF